MWALVIAILEKVIVLANAVQALDWLRTWWKKITKKNKKDKVK